MGGCTNVVIVVVFVDRKTKCMQESDLMDRDFVLPGSAEFKGSPTFTEFSPGDEFQPETSEYNRITTL